MVFLKRKRLFFWLLRAYLKKWGKLILFISITVAIILSLLIFKRDFLISLVPVDRNTTIGVAGIYAESDFPNFLPEDILNNVSRGLTKVNPKGEVVPDIAKSWEIKDDGKTYVFYLRDDVYFADGEKLDSSNINYNFEEEVKIERPAKSVIVFKLKDKYSPFLVTLANRKVFKDNFIGVSDYKIKELKTTNGFIDFVELKSTKEKKTLKYQFYPTQKALKDAYVLGNVNEIKDINNLDYKDDINIGRFKNTKSSKEINETKIATIFLNNRDPLLSDKKIRKALAYSLPDRFEEGQRAHVPYPPNFWVTSDDDKYKTDLENAKQLLSESEASDSGKLKIELKVLPQYRSVADTIALHWKKLGIETQITPVDGIPSPYQAFLGELPVLKDPDQYPIWHTGQASNITNYRNLRIDKLLEDGRTITDRNERKEIYTDFQKYLLDDMPAIFLYFPYTYTVSRK